MRRDADSPEAVCLNGLTKRFEAGAGSCRATVTVLAGATARALRGETVAIVGDRGAGKTTLLLCASGLMRPDDGSVRWMGGQGPRRQLRRPRYVNCRSLRVDSGRASEPFLPLLFLDSCDALSGEARRIGVELIDDVRDRGETVILAGRSVEACASLTGDGRSLRVLYLKQGHLVEGGNSTIRRAVRPLPDGPPGRAPHPLGDVTHHPQEEHVAGISL